MTESLIAKSHAQLAATIGVSPKTIESWRSAGMPGKRGRYVVVDVLNWKADRDAARRKKPQGLDEIELEHAQVKLDRDAIRLSKERGELVPRASVEAEFVLRVSELTASLDGLAHNMAARLAPAMDPRKVAEIIRGTVWRFRDAYARGLPQEFVPAEGDAEETPSAR